MDDVATTSHDSTKSILKSKINPTRRNVEWLTLAWCENEQQTNNVVPASVSAKLAPSTTASIKISDICWKALKTNINRGQSASNSSSKSNSGSNNHSHSNNISNNNCNIHRTNGNSAASTKRINKTSMSTPDERLAFIETGTNGRNEIGCCKCNNNYHYKRNGDTNKLLNRIRSIVPWGMPWAIMVNSIIQVYR